MPHEFYLRRHGDGCALIAPGTFARPSTTTILRDALKFSSHDEASGFARTHGITGVDVVELVATEVAHAA